MRVAQPIVVDETGREVLTKLARSRTAPVRVVQRARIILMAADGEQNQAIATALNIMPETVARCRKRYLDGGLAALEKDAPRSGRKPVITAEIVQRVVHKTTQEKPDNATHWSTRTMARAIGISEKSVRRIWQQHGLKPHRQRTFKVSRDPQLAEKVETIVGLYVNPPEHAIVLCCDEKSQIQALDRSQPGLPLKPGRCGTMTHDYKRNGTATLFAALNTLDGSIISMCEERHRHQEWLNFLKLIDQLTPADKQVYIIADNYATHKHPKVNRWFKRHPRFHMRFTPTGASWLNMVERFFRDLIQDRLRRGIFRNVEELILAIVDYVGKHHDKPKPFIWTAKASDILEKVKRARAALDNR